MLTGRFSKVENDKVVIKIDQPKNVNGAAAKDFEVNLAEVDRTWSQNYS